MGSCTGFSVPVAKYFGAGKLDKMRDYIFNGAAPAVGSVRYFRGMLMHISL